MNDELIYRTHDHPEANGATPKLGDVEYPMTFTLEDGRTLVVKTGKVGFDTLTSLMMDMLSESPNHNDGSLDIPGRNLTAELTAANERIKELEEERENWRMSSVCRELAAENSRLREFLVEKKREALSASERAQRNEDKIAEEHYSGRHQAFFQVQQFLSDHTPPVANEAKP